MAPIYFRRGDVCGLHESGSRGLRLRSPRGRARDAGRSAGGGDAGREARGARGAADAGDPKQSFKVTIYPAYTTAGQPTTFEVTVANLGSGDDAAIRPAVAADGLHAVAAGPERAVPAQDAGAANGRCRCGSISLKPGREAAVQRQRDRAQACGNTALHWTSHALPGRDPVGRAAVAPDGVRATLASRWSARGRPCAATAARRARPTCPRRSAATASSRTRPRARCAGRSTSARRLTCGAYQFRDPNWYDSVVTPPPPGRRRPIASVAPIVDTVSYTIKNTTTQGLGFCLGATYDFTTASGNQAPAAKLPTGDPGVHRPAPDVHPRDAAVHLEDLADSPTRRDRLRRGDDHPDPGAGRSLGSALTAYAGAG